LLQLISIRYKLFMSNWTSGYVADIGYTYGYYKELNPQRASLAFLNAGYVPPSLGTHCELGFGQGLSVNIHAAASGSIWYGNDFNPSQAAFAQSLAASSGADAHLTDEAFKDFCNRTDLPEFDSIGLHGIWSWISDENRAIIVDFIRRKLKVGGVLYISYNTLPGWASFAPMRHLMTAYSSSQTANDLGILNKIQNSLAFADKLIQSQPQFIKSNPSIVFKLEKFKEQNPRYLAHEFFNKDWHPMYFSTVAEQLNSAKVEFVCSAHYLDFVDVINLTPVQSNLLNEISDLNFRESVRDFMINQQFRREYWVKGPQKLTKFQQLNLISKHRVVLTSPKSEIELKVSGNAGQANLSDAIYSPILDTLSDFEIASIEQISIAVSKFEINFDQVVQSLIILIGAGYVHSAQDETEIQKSLEITKKLNLKILQRSLFSGDILCLASPITGGAIPVNRFQQLFLFSINNGKPDPSEWARAAWSTLKSEKQRLVKEGITLESEDDNLNELEIQAQNFAITRLPILKALKVA